MKRAGGLEFQRPTSLLSGEFALLLISLRLGAAMKKLLVLAACCGVSVLGGCATTGGDPGVAINSASGRPEAYFSTPPEQTMGKLASACMDRQGSVTESTTNEVVCEMPVGAGQAILAQMLIGTRHQKPVDADATEFGA